MRTGGRGISSVMRVAHDSSLCEGSLWGEPRLRTRKDFASAEATKGRSPSGGFAIALWKPSLALFSCNWSVPKLAGRGGSVSRRDHSPKTSKRAHVSWVRKFVVKVKPIPSRSSGEGVWGRGASLREAASPPEPPSSPPHIFAPALALMRSRSGPARLQRRALR